MSELTPRPDVKRIADFRIEALARAENIGDPATLDTLPVVDVFADGEVELPGRTERVRG